MIALRSHITALGYDAIYLKHPTVQKNVSLITSLYSQKTVRRYIE